MTIPKLRQEIIDKLEQSITGQDLEYRVFNMLCAGFALGHTAAGKCDDLGQSLHTFVMFILGSEPEKLTSILNAFAAESLRAFAQHLLIAGNIREKEDA